MMTDVCRIKKILVDTYYNSNAFSLYLGLTLSLIENTIKVNFLLRSII
jgi:hypothetical protein